MSDTPKQHFSQMPDAHNAALKGETCCKLLLLFKNLSLLCYFVIILSWNTSLLDSCVMLKLSGCKSQTIMHVTWLASVYVGLMSISVYFMIYEIDYI